MNNAFGVGQRVKVLVEYDTEHHQEIGTVNMVLNYEIGAFEVRFENGDLERFDADELELADAPPAPASGDGVETWGVHPTQRELEAYGDGYAAGLLDGPKYAPLMNEIADLRAQLAASERSREATVADNLRLNRLLRRR